jgi:hypothetical protein
MTANKQAQVQLEIAQIIEGSRHFEEMLLTDSKTAASKIIKFLKKENLLSSYKEEMLTNALN